MYKVEGKTADLKMFGVSRLRVQIKLTFAVLPGAITTLNKHSLGHTKPPGRGFDSCSMLACNTTTKRPLVTKFLKRQLEKRTRLFFGGLEPDQEKRNVKLWIPISSPASSFSGLSKILSQFFICFAFVIANRHTIHRVSERIPFAAASGVLGLD